MDLGLTELAELLDVTEQVVRDWVQDGLLPGYSINDEFRFGKEEVEDWILHNGELVKEAGSFARDLSLKYTLYKALHRGGVINGLDCLDKNDVLLKVSSYIAEKFALDSQMLFEMLCQRESILSTGIGQGIAIPHARDFLINPYYDVVVTVFLKNPVEFFALDNQPVDILFFLFAGDDKRHLHLVNKVVHLGMSPEARGFLKTFPEKEKLLSYIKSWESQIR